MKRTAPAFPEMERLISTVRSLQPLERPAELVELAARIGDEQPLDDESRDRWAEGIAATVAKLDD